MIVKSARPIQSIPVAAGHLCGLTWFRGLLWYSDASLNQIRGIDVVTSSIVRQLPCPDVRTGLTWVDTNLVQVVGSSGKRALLFIDVETGATRRELPDPRSEGELCGIESGDHGLWMGYKNPNVLELRSLPEAKCIESIPLPSPPAGVTKVGELIAFADYQQGQIHLVDRTQKAIITTVKVTGNPTGLTWTGSHLWYCDYQNAQLRSIEYMTSS